MPETKTGLVGELGLGNSERLWGDRASLCEAHKNRLLLHYGIDPERPEIKTLVEGGQLRSVTSQEIEDLTGWKVDGSGLYIGYPGNEAFVIRPDNPSAGGPKYLHPKGEPNSLFIPNPRLRTSGLLKVSLKPFAAFSEAFLWWPWVESTTGGPQAQRRNCWPKGRS